jgi:voltage-gated potassium channel
MVLALCVLPLIAVEHFAELRPRALEGLEATYALIWVVFLADYVIRLLLAPDRKRYFRTDWLEMVIVVLTVPVGLNPFEVLRSARALRLLRVLRIGAVAARGAQRIVRLPRTQNSQLAVGLATFTMLALVSSVLVLAVEEGRAGSQINTMGDAMWWAVATVTTIGYGDVVPQTSTGRVMAFVLMLAGVGLVGVVVSNFAARFMSGIERRMGEVAMSAEEQALRHVEARLAEVCERLARIEARDQPLTD